MDGPPAGLPCGRVTVQELKWACVCVKQSALESKATCGLFLQADIKSQLIRQRAGRRQAAQVLQQRRQQLGKWDDITLSGAIVHVRHAHHAGVNVSQEDGVSVEQRSVPSTLRWLGKNSKNTQRLNHHCKAQSLGTINKKSVVLCSSGAL